MKQTSLKSNFIFNLIYQVFAIITPIITTPYISRVLSPEGIGKYSYGLSIATYFGMFGTLGITTYGQLKIAQSRDDEKLLARTISEIMELRIMTMILSILCFCVVIFNVESDARLLYAMLLFYLLGVLNDVSFVLQGLEMFKTLAVRNLIIKMVNICLIFMFVKTKSDLCIYAFIIQGTIFFGNFFLWSKVIKYFRPVNPKTAHFSTHLKNSMVYFIPTVATTVYTVLDKSMIGWITKSDAQNGYYDQAHKIEQILLVIVTAIGTVTLPRMAYLHKNKDEGAMHRIMDITINLILFISLPMCAGLFAVADILVPWFLGTDYMECVPLVRIFSLLIVIVGLDNIIGRQCLVATNRQKLYNIGVISGAVLNFIMNMILIRLIGSVGAAIASVCAEALILTLFIIFSRNMLSFKGVYKSGIKYLLLSILLAVVVWIMGQHMKVSFLTLILQVGVGVCIYLAGLLITRDAFLKQILNSVFKKRKKA